jgi:hypothetical protein
MNKQTFTQKSNGDTLNASEWNQLTNYVNTVVDTVNGIDTTAGADPHMIFDSEDKHNLTISTTAEDQYQDGSKMKGGKINIEPISDL